MIVFFFCIGLQIEPLEALSPATEVVLRSETINKGSNRGESQEGDFGVVEGEGRMTQSEDDTQLLLVLPAS